MKRFTTSTIAALALAALLGCTHELDSAQGAVATSSSALRTTSIDFDVSLRGTGTTNIHATVYSDSARRGGETILAVHGLVETGTTFERLAEAVFADRALRRRVRRIVAIDMTGHGDSGFPENLPQGARFGELTIEDNVSVVVQSIAALRRLRMAPQVIIGHSMGGLEVQAAQQQLLAQGSSLAALGVRRVVLLAPVPPHDRPWTQPPPADLSPFVVQDATLGAYLSLPPAVWIAQAYTTRAGMLVAGAPTPDQVVERGYSGPEALTTVLQLVESPIPLPTGGTLVIPRPSVDAGAFAPRRGTQLSVVSFAEDVLVPAADLADLYRHLTGDARGRRSFAVTTADAVHSMFLSNPAGMLDVLRRSL